MKELDASCLVGERVFWTTVTGNRYEGEMKEWDSNVAFVKCDDGPTRPVEC